MASKKKRCADYLKKLFCLFPPEPQEVRERPKALTFLICRVVYGHRGDPRTCSGQRNEKGVVSFVENKREPSLCYEVLTGGPGAPGSAEQSAAMDDGRGRALGVTGTSS